MLQLTFIFRDTHTNVCPVSPRFLAFHIKPSITFHAYFAELSLNNQREIFRSQLKFIYTLFIYTYVHMYIYRCYCFRYDVRTEIKRSLASILFLSSILPSFVYKVNISLFFWSTTMTYKNITNDTWTTLTEAFLNSYPLTRLSSSPNDYQILTSSNFEAKEVLIVLPVPVPPRRNPVNCLKWREHV